eukprot:7876455-Lingulodinium_polyedra.AAC.1
MYPMDEDIVDIQHVVKVKVHSFQSNHHIIHARPPRHFAQIPARGTVRAQVAQTTPPASRDSHPPCTGRPWLQS